MHKIIFDTKVLIKWQKYSWYFLLLYFLFAVIVSMLNISIPFHSGYIGVLLVLGITFIKLIVIAEEFRKIKQIKYNLIVYGLLIIIFTTIIVRLYI